MVQTDIDQLKSHLINNEWALDDAIPKTSQVMKNAHSDWIVVRGVDVIESRTSWFELILRLWRK
jgi:hypothetical protein